MHLTSHCETQSDELQHRRKKVTDKSTSVIFKELLSISLSLSEQYNLKMLLMKNRAFINTVQRISVF